MTTDALREALKEMVGLVLIKYVNLDGDVNAAVQRAEAALSAPATGGGWKMITMDDPKPGRWLVAVYTDEGFEIHALERNREFNWYHDGEETFCHSYYFEPQWYQSLPPAPETEG